MKDIQLTGLEYEESKKENERPWRKIIKISHLEISKKNFLYS